MRRFISAAVMLSALVLTVGCGGVKEVAPDESLVPEVDQAEIERQIQEGMKMGGQTEEFTPGGGAATGGDTK